MHRRTPSFAFGSILADLCIRMPARKSVAAFYATCLSCNDSPVFALCLCLWVLYGSTGSAAAVAMESVHGLYMLEHAVFRLCLGVSPNGFCWVDSTSNAGGPTFLCAQQSIWTMHMHSLERLEPDLFYL